MRPSQEYLGFRFALFLNNWRIVYQEQAESDCSWRIKDFHPWERQLYGSDHSVSRQNYCWLLTPSLFLLGIIEHRDQPHSPIRYFTQEDINQGNIMYRPPTAAPHLQEIMAFSFAGNAFFLYFEAPKALYSTTTPCGSSGHTFNKALFCASCMARPKWALEI